MSDIIKFPKIGDGLNRQLQEAMKRKDYERAYDIINEMEKHVELSSEEQLTKLEVLDELESYVELREEAAIMLNSGHPNYADVLEYFLQSMIHLKQYRTVMQMVDSIRSEDVSHALHMRLLPLYDRAKAALSKKDESFDITRFVNFPPQEQLMFLISALKEEYYPFTDSIKYILENEVIEPTVQTLMMQYLWAGGAGGTVTFNKFGNEYTVNIDDKDGLDETMISHEVTPAVIQWFDVHAEPLKSNASEMMHAVELLTYPYVFDEKYEVSEITESFVLYILEMFNLEHEADFTKTKTHEELLKVIKGFYGMQID